MAMEYRSAVDSVRLVGFHEPRKARISWRKTHGESGEEFPFNPVIVDFSMRMSIIGQWPFQDPIYWRYLPYIFDLFFREYPSKIWPNIWYVYVPPCIGSWNSHWIGDSSKPCFIAPEGNSSSAPKVEAVCLSGTTRMSEHGDWPLNSWHFHTKWGPRLR